MPLEPKAGPHGWLDGRLTLTQPARGHRSGTDAVLLAAAGPEGFDGLALDFGAGVGAVGLAFAVLEPRARVGLLEIDPGLAGLARVNIEANGLAERAFVLEGDILGEKMIGWPRPGSVDLVLANPPFLDSLRSRVPADPMRGLAHVMPEGGLPAWIGTAARVLAKGGILTMIHRADRLEAALLALAPVFGSPRVMPIYPRRGADAARILVRAVKGGRAPLTIRPGLELHGPGSSFSETAEAIHRGRGRIEL